MALPGWLDPLYTAEEMRASDAWAIDEVGVPSLDLMERAWTGEIAGDAVRAAATATFHGTKIGLRVAPGKFHAGRVEVIDIGIPRGAPSAASAGLISRRVVDLVPHRAPDGSKFKSGTVVI